MRLRWINVDTTLTCTSMGFGKELWVPLRNHSEVLSWYLSLRARKDDLTMPDSTTIRIIGITGEFAGTTVVSDNTQIVRISLDDPRLLLDLKRGDDTFQFLEKFTRDGFGLLRRNNRLEFDAIDSYLTDFRLANYECRTILYQRKPRGTGLTLQLEGHMTNEFLRIDFVTHNPEAEIYRETLMYEIPNRHFLGKPAHKIEFDGARVSVTRRLRKPYFSQDGQLALRKFNTPKDQRAEYYTWERTLSQIAPGYR